ncbi:MAG: hypothetical protein GY941_03370 [Planctomycetes bacterium]|nr:hypothetical protein [Planctomycetota bacterium]
MKPTYKIWISLFLGLLLWYGYTSESEASVLEELVLFTPSEADQLRQTKEDWNLIPRTRGALPDGPLIRVKDPQIKNSYYGPTVRIFSPAKILVSFEENRAPVDMESLQIKAKKGFITKTLTNRFKPYIEGTSINVEKMRVPTGRFTLNVKIADINGSETSETYRLVVKKK